MFADKKLDYIDALTHPEPTTKKRGLWVWLGLMVSIVAFVGIMIVLAQLKTNDLSGVVIRDKNEWQVVDDLPAYPQHIAVGDSIWIISNGNELIRFENYSGEIWRWYQIQNGDTVKQLAKDFHSTSQSIRGSNDNVGDGELPVGEWIWIQGYQTYTYEDLGISENAVIGDVIAFGNQAWLYIIDSRIHSVLHFDGQTWQPLDNIEFSGNVTLFFGTRLADSSPIVFALDQSNDLYRLDLATETPFVNLDDGRSELQLSPKPYDIKTTIGVTSDGDIYALDDVLIRYDGVAWSLLTLPENVNLTELRIFDTINQQLWLRQDNTIWSFDVDEQQRQAYTPDDMGMPDNTILYGVAYDGAKTLFATTNGIVTYDGERWFLEFESETEAPIYEVAYGNYDQVWAITEGERYDNLVIQGVAVVALLVFFVAVIGFSGSILKRFLNLESSDKTRTIVEQAINEKLPTSKDMKSQWEMGWRSVLVSISPLIFIAIIALIPFLAWGPDTINNLEKLVEDISDLFDRFFPNAPAWVKDVIKRVLVAVLFFILGLPAVLFAIMRTKDPEQRARLRRNIVATFVGIVAFGLFETLVSTTPTVLGVILIMVFVVLGGVFAYYLIYGTLRSPNAAIRRGDYNKVLEGIENPKIAESTNPLLLWSTGSMLLLAGRFKEAEDMLRRAILNQDQIGVILSTQFHPVAHLGAALLGQGRYDEARKSLEASLAINSKNGWAYLRLSDTYLFQGESPDTVLELLDKAYKHRSGNFMLYGAEKYVVNEIWANRAWALGLMGQSQEANDALEKAFDKFPEKFVPVYASLLWRAGKVMQVQRHRSKAREYFLKSLEVDPIGAYAERSRQSLKKLDRL